jgi:hypothetical protein
MIPLEPPNKQQAHDVENQENSGPYARYLDSWYRAVAGGDAGCSHRQHDDHERPLQQHHRVLNIDRERLPADHEIGERNHDHRDRDAAEQAVGSEVDIAEGGCGAGEAHLGSELATARNDVLTNACPRRVRSAMTWL